MWNKQVFAAIFWDKSLTALTTSNQFLQLLTVKNTEHHLTVHLNTNYIKLHNQQGVFWRVGGSQIVAIT